MDASEKLSRDLTVLVAMAGEMEAYLNSDVLFWPMMTGGLPKLTLGGYLYRQHRLWALRGQLSAAEQAQLISAREQFSRTLTEKIVRFEQRAHRELAARFRQWQEFLKDLTWEKRAAVSTYASAVTTRAMIHALVDMLQTPPYEMEEAIPRQLTLLDSNLRRRWLPGDFVWPQKWQPAYPQAEFWWLYGRPR